MANTKRETRFPVRGTPGGWRDRWDEPIDHAALRAQAETAERRLEQRTAALAPAWRAEIEAERRKEKRRGA